MIIADKDKPTMNNATVTLTEFKNWMNERIDEYETDHQTMYDGWHDSDDDYNCGSCEGYYRAMRDVEEYLKKKVDENANV